MRPLVLICDDDRLLCNSLARDLGEKGCSTAVDTASLAFELAGMLRPAAIVLDLSQRRNGLSILKRLKADRATAHIPVIIYTASQLSRDAVEAKQMGASAFLRKPDPKFAESVAELAKAQGVSAAAMQATIAGGAARR